MLQRQIIVPGRRKKENQFSQVDDFYGQGCFDADEFDDITSLLVKRLQLENNEEKEEEGNKVKKCCVDDEKFITDIVELKSILFPTAISEITAEIKSCPTHARDLNKKAKQQIIEKKVEYKNISFGEVDYMDQFNAADQKKKIKNQKRKKSKHNLYKTIHKD